MLEGKGMITRRSKTQVNHERDPIQGGRLARQFDSMLRSLRHLEDRKLSSEALQAKLHTSTGPRKSCICYLCAPERWKALPDCSNPDPFLDFDPSLGADQSACALLSKVPAEIRLMIWEIMFAGYLIMPVIWGSDHPLHSVCPEPLYPWLVERKKIYDRLVQPHLLLKWDVYDGKYRGLHRTCRQIYSETKQMLFQCNLFYIEQHSIPKSIQEYMRPNWLSSITRLYIDWKRICAPDMDCKPETYQHEFDFLTEFSDLRELVIAAPEYCYRHVRLGYQDLTTAHYAEWASARQAWGRMVFPPESVRPKVRYQVLMKDEPTEQERKDFAGEIVHLPTLEAFKEKFTQITPQNPYERVTDLIRRFDNVTRKRLWFS